MQTFVKMSNRLQRKLRIIILSEVVNRRLSVPPFWLWAIF